MFWPFHHKAVANYWLKVFALYALAEAFIQLIFLFLLNNFGNAPISIIEFHLVMWVFQCLLIWPIWWVAWSVRHQKIGVQILANISFYVLYSFCWFGPVQDVIGYLYNNLMELTRTPDKRLTGYLDRGYEYSYLNYQLLKHAFRLSWFFLAAYFYNYRSEEKKRTALAVANRELQIKLLKWHLNPSFYFKTINHLRHLASENPMNTTGPILQLAKVMEYVIYEAKEKLIDVKKEVQFIGNYIQLINQQPDSNATFEMETTGRHDSLKIAPLLLAGFIDKLLTGSNVVHKPLYKLNLEFSDNEMKFYVNGDLGNGITALLLPDDAVHLRLKEFYEGRFVINNSPHNPQFKLSLKLDEES